MRKMQVTIDKKLIFGFSIILVCVVISGIFSVALLNRISISRQKLSEERRYSEALLMSRIKLFGMMHEAMSFLLDQNNKHLEEYARYKQEFETMKDEWIKLKLARKGARPEETAMNINTLYASLLSSFEQEIKLAKEGKIEQARQLEIEQSDPKQEALMTALKIEEVEK